MAGDSPAGVWLAPAPGTILIAGNSPAALQAQTSRLDQSGNIREDAYIQLTLAEGDQKYAAIDGARMKEVLREVTQISLETRDDDTRYWGRIADTRTWSPSARVDQLDLEHQRRARGHPGCSP